MSVGRIVASPTGGCGDRTAPARRDGEARSPGPPLGIYAKTEAALSDQPLRVDPETGEVLSGMAPDHRSARAERYALKSVVNRLLPTSRTSKCMRWRAPLQSVEVLKDRAHGRAFYGGLQVCARVWACPVCAAKISERRRVELVEAMDVAKAMGLSVYLLTLTVPHGLGDDVSQVVAGVLDAWRSCSTSRAGKGLRKGFKIRGTIRALEVTHGRNGFHPHLHVLLFLEPGSSPAEVEREFCPLWQRACLAADLPCPSVEHGCRVDDRPQAAAYVSKWGLESEMTKSHTKKGRNGSRTPWDFLRAILAGDDDADQCKVLFRAYVDAFHGKRQLYWSNGLRELLAVKQEATDEDIAAAQEENADLLATLTVEEWRAVLITRSEAQVLTVAELHPESLPVVLASLMQVAGHRMSEKNSKVTRKPLTSGP